MLPTLHVRAARSLLIALALIPNASAFAQSDVIHSDWRVDTGALRPSHGMMRYYDRETKLAYAFHNDGNALLITIRGADQSMARRMVETGLVVTIDTLGKKKGSPTIEFPLPMHGEHASGGGSTGEWHGGGRGQGSHHMGMGAMNMRLNTTGFKGEADGEHMIGGEGEVQAHIDMDSMDVATYDVRIPFRSLLGREITATDTLKAWSMRVTVNSAAGGGHAHEHEEGNGSGSSTDAAGDMGESGTMGGGGMGGGYGGGDGAGQGGRGGGGSAELPATFHVKFKLAFRP